MLPLLAGVLKGEQRFITWTLRGSARSAVTRQRRFRFPVPHDRTAHPAQCYAQADSPQDCVAQKEDYLECLHRTKEVGRTRGEGGMSGRELYS